jgi:hypothetical protein
LGQRKEVKRVALNHREKSKETKIKKGNGYKHFLRTTEARTAMTSTAKDSS